MLPKMIGRYQIKAELGRGGMSVVYWAHDPHFERDVAIKLLSDQLLHHPTFRIRFEREAKTIAALDHPSIVPVYDFGEEDGQPYLVMRFMTGGSLAKRLEEGPLSLSETAQIMTRLAPGLDEAHSHGVIHRDLKPSNILFDQRDDPFISDFGIAKLTEARTKLTDTGGMVGTPAYMSPEQIQGNAELDGRSDIYTLGILLYEMLTGRHPFQTDTPIGVAVKHIFEPVSRILEGHPNLSPGCRAVIATAMAKNREARYPKAADFAEAVRQLAEKEAGARAIVAGQVVTGSQQGKQERRLALIVSNNSYDDAVLAQLVKPTTDTDKLVRVLQDPQIGQFDEVTLLANGTADAIRRAISHFFTGKNVTDSLFLYFIGHAVLDARGHLYLATRDTEHDVLRGTAIPATFIADEMENSPSQHQTLILDCHYSSVVATHIPSVVGKAVDTSASFTRSGRKRVILSANNSIQYIWGKNEVIGQAAPSCFTDYLVHGLESGVADDDGDGVVTLDELFSYVQSQLMHGIPDQPIQTARKWPEEPSKIIVASNPNAVVSTASPAPADAETGPAPAGEEAAVGPEPLPLAPQQAPAWRLPEAGGAPEVDNVTTPPSTLGRWRSPAPLHRFTAVIVVLLGLIIVSGSDNGRPLPGTSHLPRVTATHNLVAAATATPTTTAEPTPTHTAQPPTPTATATAPPTQAATATATATATPTPTAPTMMATAIEVSSIFAGPDSSYEELAFIDVGEQVEILGRAESGDWLYVYDGKQTIGFVYRQRFEWVGDFEALPLIELTPTPEPVVTAATEAAACGGVTCPPLRLDLYPLSGGSCQGGTSYRTVYIRGQGGSGIYTYFWNNERLAGPLTNQGFGFEVSNEGGPSLIGVGRVVSSDGQMVEKELFISGFTCNN